MKQIEPSEIIPCEIPTGKKFRNLTGETFGRLRVEYFLGHRFAPCGRKLFYYWCKCNCGKEIFASGGELRSGQIKSCGCFRVEFSTINNTSHGLTGTPEYNTWAGMIDRCTNPNSHAWKNYGGRGITISDSWRSSFETFLSDVGKRPGPHYTLDRVNNNLGYSKDNCAWRTKKEQGRNTMTNRLITFKGETLCVTEWQERLGFANGLLFTRLQRGWSEEEALTTPQRSVSEISKHGITYNGETKTGLEWSVQMGFPGRTICVRLSLGWTLEEAFTTPVRKYDRKEHRT